MTLPHELAAKLGKPIRLLASNSQGEAFAALCAIARLLESHGHSFHTLADHVENANGNGLSDADKQKISAAIESARIEGYAEGVKAAESSSTAPAPSATPMARSSGPRSRATASVRNTDFRRNITSSSTIWRHAPCTGASRLRGNISTCTLYFLSWAGELHERNDSNDGTCHRGAHRARLCCRPGALRQWQGKLGSADVALRDLRGPSG